jgi:Uma2 family endonuclease
MATASITGRHLEMPSISIPADAHTLAGFRRWAMSDEFPERGRISFLNGEIDFDMSPEEIRSHIDPKTQLSIVLGSLINRENLGKPFIDGTLLVNKAANVSNEPDFMFCSWETLKSGKVVQAETFPGSGRVMELAGSPDLVVEIVSDSSLRKDRQILPGRYWVAGVSEYWIVDCRGAVPLLEILTRTDSGYQLAFETADGWLRSGVLNRSFRFELFINPLGDRAYRLAEQSSVSQ